jgi:hypothetical protein
VNLRKTPEFLGDVDEQFRWYLQQACVSTMRRGQLIAIPENFLNLVVCP